MPPRHSTTLFSPISQVLDGWTPPAIVVLGDESAGKSTILEQLAMLPVFPRKKRFCTRLAIHVHVGLNQGRDGPLPSSLPSWHVCIRVSIHTRAQMQGSGIRV
jgi:hypothetical protein